MIGPIGTQAHLEDCWDEPEPVLGCKDLEALQGVWISVYGRRSAEFLICGHHFTIHFADGAIYMGTFVLDPGAWPKTMDARIEEGPAPHRDLTALCIYELQGEILRWCTAGPGQLERPSCFPTKEDPHYLYLVFQKQPSWRYRS